MWYNVVSILVLSILNSMWRFFMKIAVVGSRNIAIEDFSDYIPKCDEIITGGAKGVDSYIAEYANKNNIKLTVILPDYRRYGRAAPIIRNKKIVDCADEIFVFWDGMSRGTYSVIEFAKKAQKKCNIVIIE